ncbi:MAG: glycosyltransferase family 4 protein [Candidatus Kerfeldbacteria bacterium]|nr:glycosyltransferase family 4 protein [Candidatus Kerfeldbacteria bacterium]
MSKLLLITSDYPPRQGGVARYYQGLVKALGDAQVLTTVAGPSEAGVWRWSWWWPGWPHWLPLLWLVPYAKLKYGARVLAAGQVLPIGTALLFMRAAFGWPYIIFVHGLDVNLALASSWKRWLLGLILSRAELVVANSQFTKGLTVPAGAPAERIIVVYPCPNLAPPLPATVSALRQRYGLTGRSVILSVARLVERKGIDDILSVWPQLQRQFPGLTYVVVGDGPERDSLQHLAKETGGHVIFTGEISDHELSAWYELSELFVLTPKSDKVDVEGFGLVYLEAQAAGKPVVGSNVGGVPEAVGDGGLLIRNQSDLLTALAGLLTESARRRKLGGQGRQRISRVFTWEVQAGKLRKHLYDTGQN